MLKVINNIIVGKNNIYNGDIVRIKKGDCKYIYFDGRLFTASGNYTQSRDNLVHIEEPERIFYLKDPAFENRLANLTDYINKKINLGSRLYHIESDSRINKAKVEVHYSAYSDSIIIRVATITLTLRNTTLISTINIECSMIANDTMNEPVEISQGMLIPIINKPLNLIF